MTLEHLIITRFSVPTTLAGKRRVVDANDEYLRYRLGLFERFCLPSILAQTEKRFKWFVLFGADTPDWLRAELDEYESRKQFIPLYAASFAEALDSIREWVCINVSEGGWLLTTRLDNDDALSCRYVEIVQSLCGTEYEQYYFNAREGQQVTVRSVDPKEWGYYHLRYPGSPFVSMLERVREEPVKMVYHRPHGSIKSKIVGYPVKDLTHFPLWMQILHGKNIGNGLWTRKRSAPDFTSFPFLKGYHDLTIL